ncbi:MAG: hypothetical protein ACFE9Z_03005 [Promethearchaeota archaeon]
MTEKKDNFILKWNDDIGQYIPIESDAAMNEGIFIELVEAEDKWRYFYITGASLIVRRTALRAANGISKAGFVHPKTNTRYGAECNLEEEISPYEDMLNNLRKSQRSWYKGDYKQY